MFLFRPWCITQLLRVCQEYANDMTARKSLPGGCIAIVQFPMYELRTRCPLAADLCEFSNVGGLRSRDQGERQLQSSIAGNCEVNPPSPYKE
jgi:hypothetical protein